jgi:glycosyltransferase involved in cell wall biosynthesis
MMNGVPCVASNLPGVRQPVLTHKMGAIFPIGDSEQLADKIIEVLSLDEHHMNAAADFSGYSPDQVAKEYETLFCEILDNL